MKSELLDIYDGTGRHIGAKPRDEVHRHGLWHKTIHCWVIYKDIDNVDWIVLQKRSDKKKSWPGFVDITAAGHYAAGERLEAGVREIQEEIGVTTPFNTLIPLGTRVCVEEFQSGVENHEFQNVFFLIDDRPLEDYALGGDELSGILRAPVQAMLELFRGECASVDAPGLELVLRDNMLVRVPRTFTVTRDHFIPSLDQYNYKVMILATRTLQGERDLLI